MTHPPALGAPPIRVTGSIGERLQAAWRRVTQGPEYTLDFILSDVTGSHWRVFTEYAGDISGRYLGGVALASTLVGEEPERLDAVLRGILAAQRPDGSFDHSGLLQSCPDALIYGHGRLLLGLVEHHSARPSGAVLAALRRLADWICGAAPRWLTPEQQARPEYLYFTQCLEGLVGAYRLTGEPRHLAAAEEIARSLWAEPKHHSHSYLSSLLGTLSLFHATGDTGWLQAVQTRWRAVVRMVSPDGGVPETLPDKPATEFCSVGDWLMLNLRLFRATGRSLYLETAERVLFNALPFNQFCTGGFGTWRPDLGRGYAGRVEVGSGEAYWCCCLHGVRTLAEVVASAAGPGPDPGSLELSLQVPCTIPLPGDEGGSVTVETAYPEEGRTRVTFSLAAPRRLALRLRVPPWAEEPRARVDGPEITPGGEEGVLIADREWRDGDCLNLQFGLRLRLESGGAEVAPRQGATLRGVSLWWGPVLLGIDEMLNARGPSNERDFYTAPSCLVLPQGRGIRLPRQEAPLRLQWPSLAFRCSAAFEEGSADPAHGDAVLLTPLARRMEHQPPCAPSVRTQYDVRFAAPAEPERPGP